MMESGYRSSCGRPEPAQNNNQALTLAELIRTQEYLRRLWLHTANENFKISLHECEKLIRERPPQ